MSKMGEIGEAVLGLVKFFLFVCFVFFAMGAIGLLMSDNYQKKALSAFEAKNYREAVNWFMKLEAKGFKPEDDGYYFHGVALAEVNQPEKAFEQIKCYLSRTGTQGTYHQQALQRYSELSQPSLVAGELWTNSVGMEFVTIPAGSFMIGSNTGEENEKPVHEVQIREAFKLMTTEVTQGQWQAVMGRNPPFFMDFMDCGSHCPVEEVRWNDVQQFIAQLNAMTGERYRLPSEDEWEYAARAGTQTDYAWGDEASHEYANYGSDTCCDGLAKGRDQWVEISPVKSFAPNAWGLYDMHGNVEEWALQGSFLINQGRLCTTSARDFDGNPPVIRGGSWKSTPKLLRVSSRTRIFASYRDAYGFGLRLVHSVPNPDWADPWVMSTCGRAP